MIIKKIYRIIRNCLALVGLFAIVGAGSAFFVLTLKTGLPPLDLTEKVLRKSMAFVLPGMAGTNQTPLVDPNKFQPVELSPHVSTIPIDESILYNRRILRVGPKRSLKLPSEAARIAKANDIIEIDAGLYVSDAALWSVPQLTIRGVGGRAVLDAGGSSIEGKAIWLIRGNDIFIENIGFKNCKVRDRNGAGIRVEGDNLKVRNCLFWSNENGILCGNIKSIHSLTVRYSEFGFNGYGDGQSHGIYVGGIDEFIFEFNYVHHTRSGHHVKSRARSNQIGYNFLTDHEAGNSSYAIDFEDGGKGVVIGNVIHQSKVTENSALIHYGMPNSSSGEPFYIVNNTVSSDRHTGIFVLNHSPAEGLIVNNILVGKLQIGVGKNKENSNFLADISCFSPLPYNPKALKYDCAAVNAGLILNKNADVDLVPRFEYIHPLSKKERNQFEKIDIGAYEYE